MQTPSNRKHRGRAESTPDDRAQRRYFRAANIFMYARRIASSRSTTSIQRMNARISTSHPINNNKRMLRWHYDAMS
jgi:hypothetical protein